MRVFPTVRKGEHVNIVCARALEKSVRTTVPAGAGEGGGAWHPSSGVGGVVGRWVTIPISSSLETHTSKTTGLPRVFLRVLVNKKYRYAVVLKAKTRNIKLLHERSK